MRRILVICGYLVVAALFTVPVRSQEPKILAPDLLPPTTIGTTPKAPMAPVVPVAAASARKHSFDRFRKLDDVPELTRIQYLTTQRGIEWMSRDGIHLQSGRFLPGLLPALARGLDENDFLNQAYAAMCLARIARWTGEEKHTVRASQTILSLLVETKDLPESPGARALPKNAPYVARGQMHLAASGLLAAAIYELPEAPPEAYKYADALCQSIRLQARQDGAVGDKHASDSEATSHIGWALYAIALSHRAQPQSWKADLLTAAVAYYRKEFQRAPHPQVIAPMTAAFVEAYLVTRSPACAEFVMEMNDWLRNLQYDKLDRYPQWRGGFMTLGQGKLVQSAPGIETAEYAQSLADCCRLMRHLDRPDLERYESMRNALIRSLQFLSNLQYAEENTQHFATHFRPMLIGSFRSTLTDGTIRIEQSASALSAFGKYLAYVAD